MPRLIRRSCTFCCFLWFCISTAGLHARIEIGGDINYYTPDSVEKYSGSYNTPIFSSTTAYNGFLAAASIRYAFALTEQLTLSVGGYGGYSKLSPSVLYSDQSSSKMTSVRGGIDSVFAVSPANWAIHPFMRIMAGIDFLQETTSGDYPGAPYFKQGTYEVIANWKAFQYGFLFGARIPVTNTIRVYLQAGHIATLAAKPEITSVVIQAAPTAVQGTLIGPDAYSYSGLMIGTGIEFAF